MSETPVPQDPERGADPWLEWMDDPAYLAYRAEDEDSGDLDDYADPDNAPFEPPVSCGGQDQPMAGFACISVILDIRRDHGSRQARRHRRI